MGDVVDIAGKRKSAAGGSGGDGKSPRAAKPAHGACGAKTRGGGKCKKQKGWGTNHLGSGRCKLHGGNTSSGEASAAKEAALIMGEALDIEPHEALITCVRIAAGEVAYCSREIAGLEKATEPTAFGAVLNIWIKTRQVAMAQLAKYSKMALDAGVAERQVQLAERYGEMLATLISGILGDLELTKKQQKAAPAIVTTHLQLLEGAQGA
jgi:hypothetical protein